MENLLKNRPTLGKEQNDLLNSIVNRSRKRKPANKNEDQTRKNRNVVKQMIDGLKSSVPEYSRKKNWLNSLDSLLKEQQEEAKAYVVTSESKPKRKLKISQALLVKVANQSLEKTAERLKEKKIEPIESPKPTVEKEVTVTLTTEAPKKRTLKIKANLVTKAKEEAPKVVEKAEEAKFPILYTKSKTGKVQQWFVEVLKEEDETAKIVTRWGYKDGKQALSEKEIKEGKNKGKANETTAFQQAVSEAKSAWEKKKTREGYAETVGEAAVPGVAAANKVSTEETLLPMLAQNYRKQSRKIVFPSYVQAKLDGVRSLFRNGVFTSRTGKPFGFLDHISKELKPAIDEGLILDGEIYSTTIPFQQLTGLVQKKHLTAKDIENLKQVSLWVYDVVTPHPFENRLATLTEFFTKHTFTYVHLLPTEEAKTKEEIKTFHDKYVGAGYEGVIIRNKKGLYRLATRSENLQKYKEFEDAEFPIVDFMEGEGNEKGAVIWICETEGGKRFKVRPTGTIEDRRAIFKEGKKYIGKKLTVKYQEMTADGIPRFGVGLAIRDYE